MQAKLIVADPIPLFRAAVSAIVAGVLGQPAVEVGDQERLSEEIAGGPVGFVVLSLDLPGAQGCAPLVRLRSRLPHVPLLAVGMDEDPGVVARTRQFGASGFVPMACSAAALAATIEAVAAGRGWPAPASPRRAQAAVRAWRPVDLLTPQQLRVLQLVADGLPNKKIGHTLGLSENTVRCHVTAILSKLECQSRTQAALLVSSFRA